MWPSSSRSMLEENKVRKMPLNHSTQRHTEAETEIIQPLADHIYSKGLH